MYVCFIENNGIKAYWQFLKLDYNEKQLCHSNLYIKSVFTYS